MLAYIKRISSVILLCALVLSLSSCFIIINRPEETDQVHTTEAPSTEPTPVVTAPPAIEDEGISRSERARRRLNSLVNFDMDGTTLLLVTADAGIPAPIGSSRYLDKERWNALNEVSEKYGAELIVTRESRVYMKTKLLDAKTSGLYYADIVAFPSTELGTFFADDLLYDISKLPFVSPYEEYYYSMATDAATVDGHIYGVAGESCVDFGDFGCIYVNMSKAAALGFGDIHTTVDDGLWTYDKMLEYIKLYEYSPDGEYVGDAAFSSVRERGDAVRMMFESTGVRYVYSEDGEQVLYSPVGRVEAAVDSLRQLFYKGNYGFVMNDEDVDKYWDVELEELLEPGQAELMRDGKGVFLLGTLSDLSRVYISDDPIVPIPVPKLNGEQAEYSTPTAGETMMYSIPADGANITESGIFVEALNVRAYEAVSEAYITNALHYYIRHERTVEMMDLIMKRPYFDMAVNFGSQYGALAQGAWKTIVQAAETDFNVLDVHFWYYYGARDTLEEIKGSAK